MIHAYVLAKDPKHILWVKRSIRGHFRAPFCRVRLRLLRFLLLVLIVSYVWYWNKVFYLRNFWKQRFPNVRSTSIIFGSRCSSIWAWFMLLCVCVCVCVSTAVCIVCQCPWPWLYFEWQINQCFGKHGNVNLI